MRMLREKCAELLHALTAVACTLVQLIVKNSFQLTEVKSEVRVTIFVRTGAETMKIIAAVLFFGLIATLTAAQAPPTAQRTMFMGHQLGESVQQWLQASDQPKRCAEENRHTPGNVRFCKVIDEIAEGRAANFVTSHSGQSVVAGDRWYFENGTLTAVLSDGLPYNKTVDELLERYGPATNNRTFTVDHVFGPNYVVSSHQWTMSDGAVMIIAEDKTAVGYAKLLVSTQDFLHKELSANNPF
jgi:hypothetical protein